MPTCSPWGCEELDMTWLVNNTPTLCIFRFHLFFFLSSLGLHCCTGFSPVVVSRNYSLALACKLLIAVASLVVEHRLQGSWASVVTAPGLRTCGSRALKHSLSSCDTWAQLLPRYVGSSQGLNLCLIHWPVDSLSLSRWRRLRFHHFVKFL